MLSSLFTEACGLLLAHHVPGVFVGGVGVFVGIDAHGLAANGNGVGVLSADVVAGHVVLGFFPGALVADGIFGVIVHGACLVVIDGLARFNRAQGVADRNEGLALDFVALYFQLDGVVVAARRRRDFCVRRDLVCGTDAVLDAFLFQGIGTCLV